MAGEGEGPHGACQDWSNTRWRIPGPWSNVPGPVLPKSFVGERTGFGHSQQFPEQLHWRSCPALRIGSSMSRPRLADLRAQLDALDPTSSERASHVVDQVLQDAVRRGASDVHFEPTHRAVEVRYRLDGVLQPAATLSREVAPNVTARLKVL